MNHLSLYDYPCQPPRMMGLGLLLALLLGLSGCSNHSRLAGTESAPNLLGDNTLQTQLNARAGKPLDWSLPDDKVMALNEDMQNFLDTYVPSRGTHRTKLEALLNAVMHNGLLGLDYNPQATYSASDTFFYQEGNCLSFSLMFIAMAREVGLQAKFNQVNIPPSWDMLNQQLLVNYKHINVKMRERGGHRIVDLNIKDYKSHYRQHTVSDEQAKAQYYNNRAMTFLADDDSHNAYRYMRKAIALAPDQGYLWGNLATVYRRESLLPQAETAYLQALALESNNHVAASNLSRLYTQQGNTERANYYRQQVRQFRQNNPYYRFFMAEQALNKSQLTQARQHIDAAIKKESKDPRFHALAERIVRAEQAQLLANDLH